MVRRAAQSLNRPTWVSGVLNTKAGLVPVVSSEWSRADYIGQVRSRMSAFRMSYTVQPGLYGIGTPDEDSDVFVSANYKLSFDILRRELKGLNGWILVLDTKGINVWCAAGKGTFGTAELVKRITAANLAGIVSHRKIIVPQLGATGVRASEVKQKTGFAVYFGPVEARDIKEYLNSNYHATPGMRKITFTMIQRLVLTPLELNPALKMYPWFALSVLILFGLDPTGIIFRKAWFEGWPFLVLGLAGVLTGAFLTPVLLPVVPFRSFALKGIITGAAVAALLVFVAPLFDGGSNYLKASGMLLVPVLASYLALQFTGATTFTSISGVKKELKFALPLYFIGLAVSFIFIILYKLETWGII